MYLAILLVLLGLLTISATGIAVYSILSSLVLKEEMIALKIQLSRYSLDIRNQNNLIDALKDDIRNFSFSNKGNELLSEEENKEIEEYFNGFNMKDFEKKNKKSSEEFEEEYLSPLKSRGL